MKTSLTLFLALLISLPTLGQRILIADNTASAPIGDHIYASLQEAIDASQEGDVIQVVPSPTTYGNITIAKEKSGITILGSGYNAGNQYKSLVGGLNINADNITISGMTVQWVFAIDSGSNEFKIKNILIKNTASEYEFDISRSSNVIISSCYIKGDRNNSIINSERIVVVNSIISAHYSQIFNTNISNSIILNNIYARFSGSFIGNTISDNIILTELSADSQHSSSRFINNYSKFDLKIGERSNVGSGNIIDADATIENVFVQDGNGWLNNFNPTLIEGSTLIGAGSDGTDIGVFGGGGTYSRTGVVLPYIQEIQAPLTFKVGSTQEVTIKASGN